MDGSGVGGRVIAGIRPIILSSALTAVNTLLDQCRTPAAYLRLSARNSSLVALFLRKLPGIRGRGPGCCFSAPRIAMQQSPRMLCDARDNSPPAVLFLLFAMFN